MTYIASPIGKLLLDLVNLYLRLLLKIDVVYTSQYPHDHYCDVGLAWACIHKDYLASLLILFLIKVSAYLFYDFSLVVVSLKDAWR